MSINVDPPGPVTGNSPPWLGVGWGGPGVGCVGVGVGGAGCVGVGVGVAGKISKVTPVPADGMARTALNPRADAGSAASTGGTASARLAAASAPPTR
ncbi:hypothetical protein JOD64_002514 [Micromonospora luteifusca]|uniref:Uncharacterized protein n=1 Tax=Micromonospora luteifusca TaxID=709860 RepID=A0ABS2LT24_9ACTN|nr:hypothetical protein [Micromonospora luteifusca]